MHLNPSISLTGAVLRGSKIEKHTYIYICIYKYIEREIWEFFFLKSLSLLKCSHNFTLIYLK